MPPAPERERAAHWGDSSKGGSAPILGTEQPFEARQEDVTVNGSLDERQAQAAAVNDYVEGVLAGDPAARIVVLGDMNEFEFVSRELPQVRTVMLEDDTFIVHKKRTLELAEELIRYGIGRQAVCLAQRAEPDGRGMGLTVDQ